MGRGIATRQSFTELLPAICCQPSPIYRTLCENDVDKKLCPLTPDILGEYFILDRWQNHRRYMETLTEIAWDYKSWPSVEFITRTAQDFPESHVIDWIVDQIKRNPDSHYKKSVLLGNLVDCYGEIKKIDKAEKYFGYIYSLWWQNKNDRHISLQLAKAGFCLVFDHVDINKAVRCYDRLKESLKDYKNDEYISLQLMKAGFCLVHDYGKYDKIDQSQNIFNGLYGLWQQHKTDEYISVQLAKAGFCLVHDYGRLKQIERAQSIFDTIYDLWGQQHKSDVYIAFQLARAGFCLMSACRCIGKDKIADDMKRKVCELKPTFHGSKNTLEILETSAGISMSKLFN
jgi:tetratricopeptide (TPR) repeat protein